MSKIKSVHFFTVFIVALVWTLIVIGFSTSLGERPLRIYDWGPPAFSGVFTLIYMFIQKNKTE